MERPVNVVHVDQLAWKEQARGDRFGWRRKGLGTAAGSKRIGCSLYELPPGRRSFPYHYHCANEEAIYVLEGAGTLRCPGAEVPIAPGDYVALPVGEAGAHQILNTSEVPLRYLCLSTMIAPDIAVYPDSRKIGFFTARAPGSAAAARGLDGFVPLEARVGYWDGEE